jgi:lambda family phage portal protein
MVRNNPVASGALQTLRDNIVGSQLRLSAQPKYRLLDWDKDQASNWSSLTEDQFATWAETTECDASRHQTLLGLTVQALSGAMMNGDAIGVLMWLPRADSSWSTRIQLVESDRLATPPWLLNDTTVRGGVRIDEHNAPLGYWIAKRHPGDKRYNLLSANQDDWEYIEAFTPWGRRRVIHLYDKERSGQSRGKSVFTAVMREFRMSGEYLGHELHAAVANAVVATFLESNLDADSIAELFGNDDQTAGAYWKQIADRWNNQQVRGGKYVTLPVGTRVADNNVARPNTAFDGFMESIMRHMAAGLNMPYELLLKDFSKTNYSSARAALLEAWRYFNSRRRWLMDNWLCPIYEAWLEEAVNLGRVEAPNYYDNRFAYSCCRWVFSGRGWTDPVKEAKGVEMRLHLNITTMEDECAEQGKDYMVVMDQRLRELDQALIKTRASGLPDSVAYVLSGFAADPANNVDALMLDDATLDEDALNTNITDETATNE